MPINTHTWLKGGGEMGKRIRQKDWSETSLGAIEGWPERLKSTIDLILGNDFPMVVLWSSDLIQIYNDGYRTIMADNHPEGLGQPTPECWFEIWNFNKPIYERVRAGETVTLKDQFLQINRLGLPEDAWFSLCFSPLHDNTGEVAGVLVTVIETTERIKAKEKHKQTEGELRDSKERLRLAIQAADMHLCEVDLVNGTMEWTDEVEHNVDFPMPKTLDEAEALLHPDDKRNVIEALNQIIGQDGDFEIEYRVIDPTNQEPLWVYSAGTAVARMDEESPRVVSATKNITERKRAEMRDRFLSRLSTKIQRIGNPGRIMAVTTRLLGDRMGVGRCTYAKIAEDENHLTIMGNHSRVDTPAMESRGAMSAFGDIALQLMHQNEPFVVDDVEEDERITREDEATYTRNQIQALVCIPLHKDGKFVAKMAVHQQAPRHWLPEEIELVRTVAHRCWEAIQRARATNELRELNKTLEDRVEQRTKALKTYQNQLRSLAEELSKTEEREQQRLAAALHDNLGQLLAVGKMKVDTLKKMDLPDKVIDKVTNITELLNDAITYTRELMSDLKPPPALDKENFTDVLIWVVQKMEKHGLKVTVEDGDDDQPQPLNEEVRTTLRRCVSELLYNIIKHAGTDEARVIISYDKNIIQISVEDKGKGFDMEQEPTFDEEGGFGLFNISERMDWLGGDFTIVSEPGVGTRATLYAPLKEEYNPDMVAESGDKTYLSFLKPSGQTELWKQIRVIIVDDHEMMLKGLRKMIEAETDMVLVAEASDGEEAVKLALETAPDVIVMDVNLPGMDGIEATQKIISVQPDISIIGLSLHNRKEVVRDMKSAGAVAYLTKTEAFESLCTTIRSRVDIAK